MYANRTNTADSASRKARSAFQGSMRHLGAVLLAGTLVVAATVAALAGDARDEGAVRALGDTFANAFVHKDAELRASLFAENGTFVTPPGDYLQGRAAMVKDFGPEAEQAVNTGTAAAFSNYRIRFISPDVAAVDARLTVRNVNGPNGSITPVIPIDFYYVAVRHADGWLIQDGRTRFADAPPSGMSKAGMSKASK